MTPEDIKTLRKRLLLSQQSFAELIGVSTHTVHSWEHGKHKPTPMALRKLRQYNDEKNKEKLTEILRGLY